MKELPNYYDLRLDVSRIVPRMTQLATSQRRARAVREKGRKKNYSQFSLKENEWRKQERLLNTEEINSFVEISIRAAACPMPFNMDIWDGLVCVAKGQKITTNQGDVPIEEIHVDDIVLSYNEDKKVTEWKPVTHTTKIVKTKIVELETEKGTVRVTPDHRIFTQRGWIEAGNILSTDTIYSYV